MTDLGGAVTFASGLRRQVDVAAVDQELAGLWESLGAAQESSGAPVTTRACLLNLIALCSSPGCAEVAAETAGLLVGCHPSRSLVVTVDANADASGIESWVTAYCSLLPGGARQICSEQVMLSVRGSAAAVLPATLSSLLVPDIPTILWIPEWVPLPHAQASRTVHLCDKVLIDTGALHDDKPACRELMAFVAANADTPFGDLAWLRLSGWRDAVASMFDAPESAALLSAVTDVAISYEPEQASAPVHAALLAGWFAARLGWRVADCHSAPLGSTEARFTAERDGRTVKLVLSPGGEGPAGDGGLRSVSVFARRDGGEGASFVCRATAEPGVWSTCTPGGQATITACREHGHRGQLAALLCEALESTAREPTWEAAAGVAAQITAGANHE